MFLSFANFYQQFVKCYAKITRFLTKFLKKNVNNKQSDLFLYNEIARAAFFAFLNAFIQALILMHFNLKNKIRIKIDVFKFVIAVILSQLMYCRKNDFETQ